VVLDTIFLKNMMTLNLTKTSVLILWIMRLLFTYFMSIIVDLMFARVLSLELHMDLVLYLEVCILYQARIKNVMIQILIKEGEPLIDVDVHLWLPLNFKDKTVMLFYVWGVSHSCHGSFISETFSKKQQEIFICSQRVYTQLYEVEYRNNRSL